MTKHICNKVKECTSPCENHGRPHYGGDCSSYDGYCSEFGNVKCIKIKPDSLTATEILDNLEKALTNRNKEKDNEEWRFWYHYILNRVDELEVFFNGQ